MQALLRHEQNLLTAAFRKRSDDFLLGLNVSALLDRGNHLRQLGAIDQCNRVGFSELPGFRGELTIGGLYLPDRKAHDALLAAENIALVGPPPLLDTADRDNDLSAGGNQDGGVDECGFATRGWRVTMVLGQCHPADDTAAISGMIPA